MNSVLPGDFSDTYTRGVGTIWKQQGAFTSAGSTFTPSLTYRHDGSVWHSVVGAGLFCSARAISELGQGVKGLVDELRGVTVRDRVYKKEAELSVADWLHSTHCRRPADRDGVERFSTRPG